MPRTQQGRASQAVSVTPETSAEKVPKTHVSPWAQLAQETWYPPKLQLKVLKSSNSSTALGSIFFTGIRFTIFSCSCVCKTGHSSPVLLHTQLHSSQRVLTLFSSSVLGNLAVSSWLGSSQPPCSPATSFGTMCRILPGTERSRNTFAYEQQHQPHCGATSSASKASLRHRI